MDFSIFFNVCSVREASPYSEHMNVYMFGSLSVCLRMCVYVCVYERKREGEREIEKSEGVHVC